MDRPLRIALVGAGANIAGQHVAATSMAENPTFAGRDWSAMRNGLSMLPRC